MAKRILGLSFPRSETSVLIFPVLLKVGLHLASFARYGYFRDELYYIACSDRLALGYVDQPPLSIALLKLVRFVLGDSLFAIRLLPALAGVAAIILAGLMARRLGGGRFAQFLAALTVALAPVFLSNAGRYFSMNAFDIFFWAMAGYLVIRIVTTNAVKLWPVFGLVIGLGLLNKYSLGFFVIGLVVGLLLTSARRHLFTTRFWVGAAIAFLVFLPHVLWEVKTGFPTLEFMRNAARFKNMPLSPAAFLWEQVGEIGVAAAPIWIFGLLYYFFHKKGKSLRFLGWMFVTILVIMMAQNAKAYYLSPIYPMLLASGAVFFEDLGRRGPWRWLKPATAALVVVGGLIFVPIAIPVLPLPAYLEYQNFLGFKPPQEERSELGILPQHYADMFCWPEMAAKVAEIYERLSPEEQSECMIYARNYGEAGAIDFFGKKYDLPKAVCGHNNYWLWGYGGWKGKVAIIWGDSRDLQASRQDLERGFEQVELAATTDCPFSMPYENNRGIFLCRRMKVPIKEIWPRERQYR